MPTAKLFQSAVLGALGVNLSTVRKTLSSIMKQVQVVNTRAHSL